MMKTIVVFGATGGEGGSVARALVADGRYRVRAVTRKPSSPAAQKLRAMGAEVVHAELDSPPSLNAALQRADAAFAMARAGQQGRHLIEAIAASNVDHFILGSGGPAEPLEELVRARSIPATFAHVAFLYENFLFSYPPRPLGDGTYELTFTRGNRPVAGVAAEDVGRVIAPQFELQPMAAAIKVAGDELPASEYAAILSEVTGAKIRYGATARENIDSVAEMFDYYRLRMPQRFAADMLTFRAWARKNRHRLRASLLHAA